VEIQKVALNYPDNEEFVKKAENVLLQVKDKIARYEFMVANFYRREKLYEASNNRLLFLLEKYPESIWKDETLYMLGLNYLNLKETEKAKEVFLQLWKDYPEHEESKDIRRKLAELGVAVLPEEEVQTAAVEEPNPSAEEKPLAKSIDNSQETVAEPPSASTEPQANSEGYIVLRRDDLVFINLIREDGIEEDMLLEVYRGKQQVGTIRVFEIQEGFSIGEIVSLQGNTTIEEDDKVIIPQ
jgi:tetratricopeptide (TPR) repeat protein